MGSAWAQYIDRLRCCPEKIDSRKALQKADESSETALYFGLAETPPGLNI